MPSASDVRDSLPNPIAAASTTTGPTTTAAEEVQTGPSASTDSNSKSNEPAASTVDFKLLQPPSGKYATQAQAQAAKILAASGSASPQGLGEDLNQDKMEVDAGNEAQPRTAGQAENENGPASGSGSVNKDTDDGKLKVPEREFPIPTRKIIQIEGRRRDDLVPHQGLTSSYSNSNLKTKPSTRNQAQSSVQPGQAQAQAPEKMDGLTRELYALIGDNAPSLAQVRAELAGLGGVGGSGSGRKWMVGGGQKGMGKEKVVRRWRQTPFQPSNRSTPLTLHHWRPLPQAPIIQGTSGTDKLKGEEKDPFEAFGREGNGPNVMSYSQVEYEAWLTDDKWTPHETNYLFSLLKTYDLRFLVVTDRYAYVPPGGKTGQDGFEGVYAWPSLVGKAGGGASASGGASGRRKGKEAAISAGESVRRSSRMGVGAGGRNSRGATPVASTSTSTATHTVPPIETDIKTRTMEEIKDRYYTVCRRLLRNRPAVDEAFKEKMVKAFDYDIHREVARKKYANSLFHLTRPQMLEEEALYVELKRMEQTERRYRSDREELMRVMGGLDSGVLVPGEQGNRAFGRGEAIGVGVARGADGSVLADKLKKRRRGEDGEPAQDVDMPPPPPVKKKVDPMFDERNNITRVPPQPGQLTTSRNTHQPVYLRSTRLPTPKPHLATKTNALLSQMSISTVRLVMPTRENVVALEKVIHSAEGLVEMKRLVDRVEVEVRTLKAQRDGIVPTPAGAASGSTVVPVDPSGSAGVEDLTPKSEDGPEMTASVPKSQRNAQRSASVVSSTTSELRKKK